MARSPGGWIVWPATLYTNYDFWHTSPNFFLIRVGLVAIILGMAYVWCRWGAGLKGFSPMIEMGKCSLLVYWVHIELVYGGLSIMKGHNYTVGQATFGFAVIFVSMVLLATTRNGSKGAAKKFARGLKANFDRNKMRWEKIQPSDFSSARLCFRRPACPEF